MKTWQRNRAKNAAIKITFSLMIMLWTATACCEESTLHDVKGDLSVKADAPVGFLIRSFLDSPNSELMRGEASSSDPFFILYEGRSFPFYYDPTGTKPLADKSYEITESNVNLIDAITDTLHKSNDDLNTTMVGNALIVSETSFSSNYSWPLNAEVTETGDQELIVQSAEKLQREKYSYSSPIEQSVFKKCNPDDVVSVPSKVVTVRELLVRMLRKAAEVNYQNSKAKNWTVLYQVGSGPVDRANAPMNFQVTQIVSR